MSNIHSDAGELFFLLESCNTDVEEVKAIILENLNQNKEPASFLSSLVDFYMKPEHTRHRDILAGIREPHDKHLFDKLNDCLKSSGTRLQTLTLFGHIICKQPSWLYKVANHQLLSALIKILKSDNEITHLMSAVLIIVTLLPVIPFAMGHFLQDLFEIFTRLASWHTKRSASISEIYLMHLHVAVYALFHRLYSMYPCNFLSYLRNYCNISANEHLQVFSETIRPMIDLVRMHPMLVLFTKESEVSMNRWKSKEVHDIVAECAKFSLDPIEGTREDAPLLSSSSNALQSTLRQLRYTFDSDAEQSSEEPPNLFSTFSPVPVKDSVLVQASIESAVDWSPSVTCGLSTPPPSQQISPTSSYTTAFSPSGMQKNADESGGAAPSTGIYTPSQSVTPSPLKVDHPPFRFPTTTDVATKPLRSDSLGKSGSMFSGAPAKTEHIPLVKGASTSSTVFASLTEVAQKLEEQEQQQFPGTMEKQDITDMEVATIIGSSTIISSQSEYLNLSDQLESEDRLSPATTSHTSQQQTVVRRGGKVSSPWCPSPYFESLQSSHRSRSYSQGKKIPRRATIEVPLRRGSLKCRSSSLPDLRTLSKAQTAAFLDETGEKAKVLQRPQKEAEIAPYDHLFSAALPQHAQQPCPKCHSTAKTRYVRMSPPEILDQYIQTSLEVHLAKASAASAGNSVDAHILRAQIKLLHTQLLYERHKREVHAERNRRLLGKAKRAHALKEQNIAMKDQVKLLENEIASLTEENSKLRSKILIVSHQKDETVKKLRDELKSVTQTKITLEESTLGLKTNLSKAVEESAVLQQDLEKVKAELFNTHHELEDIQKQVALNRRLKAEADKANKELLLTVELNQKYQEKLNVLQNANHFEAELTNLRETCNQEMNNLKTAVEYRDAQVESLKCRLAEFESILLKKDHVIADQKRLLKTVKEAYEQQILACEEKYNSGKQICQQFESEILNLRQKLEKAYAERGLRRRESQGRVKCTAEKGDATVKPERSSTWSSVETTDETSQPLTSRMDVPVDSFQRRRASEPIDIDPCSATSGNRSQRSGQGQRSKLSKVRSESDESSDGEVQMLAELTGEERISGALEPITSQSLMSIVDINEACD